jgi:hypothetical protein
MADPATRDDLREIADAVRDLAAAMAAGAGAREAQRLEGQARGETVVAQIATHHTRTSSTLGELVRRIDALERAKPGAPYPLLYALIAAIVVQGGVVLHLYGQSRGQDASAAFRDVSAAAEHFSPASSPEGATP